MRVGENPRGMRSEKGETGSVGAPLFALIRGAALVAWAFLPAVPAFVPTCRDPNAQAYVFTSPYARKNAGAAA